MAWVSIAWVSMAWVSMAWVSIVWTEMVWVEPCAYLHLCSESQKVCWQPIVRVAHRVAYCGPEGHVAGQEMGILHDETPVACDIAPSSMAIIGRLRSVRGLGSNLGGACAAVFNARGCIR
jgi:hypothetical protein